MTESIIDSHLHVWDLTTGDYPWLGPQHGALFRTFTPEEAERALADAGVTAAILVQAADSVVDTRAMLDVAEKFAFVAGVVGWVDLADPAEATRQLDDFGFNPLFRGVRHLVHDDPRDEFLDLAPVRGSLAEVARRGVAFDVPDAWPRHLARVGSLASALPELTVVVDHLGKPPRGGGDFGAWAGHLRAVAAYPNTFAKVSGLQVAGQPFTVDSLRPVWEIALEAFGPQRLMYGGDWPMTVPAGGYQPHWDVVSELIGELSADEQAWLLAGTARAVYGLHELAGNGSTADSGR